MWVAAGGGAGGLSASGNLGAGGSYANMENVDLDFVYEDSGCCATERTELYCYSEDAAGYLWRV